MGEGAYLIGFLIVQRLAELIYARRNTKRLLAAGAQEFGRTHYPLIVALHAAWLAALIVAGHSRPVDLRWLAVFVMLQLARLWVLVTLGPCWTTRIIVSPGAPLCAGGPYRFLSHPNYLVVALEIAVVPLALGLPWLAVIFALANAAVLYVRISAENAALASMGAPARKPLPMVGQGDS